MPSEYNFTGKQAFGHAAAASEAAVTGHYCLKAQYQDLQFTQTLLSFLHVAKLPPLELINTLKLLEYI